MAIPKIMIDLAVIIVNWNTCAFEKMMGGSRHD